MSSKEEIEKEKQSFKEEIDNEIKVYSLVNDYTQNKTDNHRIIFQYIDELETKEQKLIEKLEDKIMIVDKLLDEMLTELSDGTKIINITGLTRKEKEEITNKRNCLIVQKHCYEEILEILKGENDEC